MKSLLILLVFSCFAFPAFSQDGPDVFQIAGVIAPSAEVNGVFKRSATLINECPCYDREGGGVGMIYFLSESNVWDANTNRNCSTYTGGGDFVTLGLGTTCNIGEGPFISNPGYENATFTNLTPIPTISQWALLILGLSLTSMALVTIRKRILATA